MIEEATLEDFAARHADQELIQRWENVMQLYMTHRDLVAEHDKKLR